ncbi:MAG: SPOR domain-containing protein [Usitatibacter sp.]
MAPPASPEASDIRRRGRQRLIGAIAIAVLLVVFVPMILDSEQRSARTNPPLEIPPRQNAPALPPPAPVPVAVPAAEPPKGGSPSEPAKKADAAPKAAAPRLEGFAVQVGAFKDEEKLAQARDKLAAARITHYIERVGTSSGGLTRLRAGPYSTREAAEQALAALKAAALEGQVVPLP